MKILTNDNYFEDDEYMSVSAFKKYEKCEVNGLKGVYNSTPSKAMLVGSYIDSYVEGTLERFKAEHPEIISTRGVSKGELKAEFKEADDICKFIDNDPTLQQFLSGEKQVTMTGEVSGVPFKIKMDSYSKGIAINDLKVMATVTNRNGEYYDFISQYGYDVQLAMYQEIVRQNTGDKLPCYIVALTKETPINSVIIQIPQLVLDKAYYRVESQIKHFYDVKLGLIEPIGCGKCNSCISSRTSTPIISMMDFIDYFE